MHTQDMLSPQPPFISSHPQPLVPPPLDQTTSQSTSSQPYSQVVRSPNLHDKVNKPMRSIVAADDLPLLLLGHPADTRPALLSHLREVFHAHEVHGHIFAFLLRRLFAHRVRRVDIRLALDLFLVAALGVHCDGQAEQGQQHHAKQHSHFVDLL